MRNPNFAGKFYPSSAEDIKKMISGFKKAKAKENAFGAIVPHAGYAYSGECANLAFSSIKQDFDTIVFLGADHVGVGFALSLEDFSTPMGIVENDKALSKEISKEVDIDEHAQEQEHSIEVQLPFLQAYFKNFKIVPIIVGKENFRGIKSLAELIYRAAEKLKRKILVIVSSDFTHYGYSYGFGLAGGWKEAEKLDKFAIKGIEKLDSSAFLEYASKTTICGSGAISCGIELCKFLGAKKSKLADYRNSAKVSKDMNSVVGYAGILIQ